MVLKPDFSLSFLARASAPNAPPQDVRTSKPFYPSQ